MNDDHNGYWLFLDDQRDPPRGPYVHKWIVVRSYNEAVEWMTSYGAPERISFDHDLGIGLSGFDVAGWMIHRDLDHQGGWLPENFVFDVHSVNPVGAANIRGLMDGYLQNRLDSTRGLV